MVIDLVHRYTRMRRKQMHPEHLSDSEISAFVDREMTPDERAAVSGHIVHCSSCRSAVAEVSRISDAYRAGSTERAAASRVMRPRISRSVIGLLAAGAAIVSISTLAARRQSTDAVESTRAAISGDSRIITAVQPDPSEQQRHDLRFVWRSIGADVYQLTILDRTGAPVFEYDVRDTVFVLPQSVALDPATQYFWRVDAIADGQVASTGARELKVAR